MSYRDVSEALRSYRDRIAHDLDLARRAAEEARERAGRVRVLETELAETERLLGESSRSKRTLPMLDTVRVAAPCEARWEDMVGDEHVRFCGRCEKNVYNLSSLPRDEAEALLVAREGAMCVRFFQRADGTIVTCDCPVGARKRRRRRALASTFGAGLMAAAAVSARPEPRMGSAVPAFATPATLPEPAPARPAGSAPPERENGRIGPPAPQPRGRWIGGTIPPPSQRSTPIRT